MNEYCSCEQVAHGDLGAVESSEHLARLIVSPQHLNAKGEIKPGAFPLKHIGASGLSLLRVDKMTLLEIETVTTGIVGTMNGQEIVGLSIAGTQAIRDLRDVSFNLRSVCVVDDPVNDAHPAPDNPAHAILISTKVRPDDELLEIQGALRRLFGQPVRPETLR